MEDLLWLIAFFLVLKFVPKIMKGIRDGVSEAINMVGRVMGWTLGAVLLIFIVKTLFI